MMLSRVEEMMTEVRERERTCHDDIKVKVYVVKGGFAVLPLEVEERKLMHEAA